jgi:hypothetical protein
MSDIGIEELMMNSYPVPIDATYHTMIVLVADANENDITWVMEVTFVPWDGASRVLLGWKVVNIHYSI